MTNIKNICDIITVNNIKKHPVKILQGNMGGYHKITINLIINHRSSMK